MTVERNPTIESVLRSLLAILDLIEREGMAAFARLGWQGNAVAGLASEIGKASNVALREFLAVLGLIDEKTVSELRTEVGDLFSRLAELDLGGELLRQRIEDLQKGHLAFASALEDLQRAQGRCIEQLERLRAGSQQLEERLRRRHERLHGVRELRRRIDGLEGSIAAAASRPGRENAVATAAGRPGGGRRE